MKFLAIYPEIIGLDVGLLISLLAIVMVFVVLYIIVICVGVMHLFFKNKKDKPAEEVKPVTAPVQKSNEIKDDDMMVAALIATIDFTSETKKDAKLVSIKQIG